MTIYDAAALIWFLLIWRAFAWATDSSPWRTKTLSYAMHEERRRWMRVMAKREVRIFDGNIMSGLQQSTSFFASTSLLAIGAGFGLLTAAEPFMNAIENSMLHLKVERETFYVKVAVLMCLYAYAFFKFGWSYRLFNYCAVMIAATPEFDDTEEDPQRNAEAAAEMNIVASKQFNYGLRSFFMAIPVLAWFIGAWAFALTATMVGAALVNRQFFSEPRRIARRAVFCDEELSQSSKR